MSITNLKKSTIRYWMFFNVCVVPIFLSLILKISSFSLNGLWQISLVGFSLLGLKGFFIDVKNEKLLRNFFVCFVIFLGWGLLSSFFGEVNFYATMYQLVSDFKPLMLIILGYALSWSFRMERLLWFVIRWFWIPALLFIIFEWIAPSSYLGFFKYSSMSADPSGLFPSRALGTFEHPSFLASISAAFVILSSSYAFVIKKNNFKILVVAAIYFLLLIFSVQRQELIACFISVALAYLLGRRHGKKNRLVFLLITFLGGFFVFWSIFGEGLKTEIEIWGYGQAGSVEHPRAQLFAGAFHLAKEYFPFGSGLGTFGGAGAEKFESATYARLGFNDYWWYGTQNYLLDTYWPNSIAESGFFGSAALFFSYISLFFYSINRVGREVDLARFYWVTSASLMLYMLLLSFSSPAFQDPRLFALTAIIFGISSKVSQKFRQARV